MKKRYVVLFCLLFLMIPTYIAISYILSGSNSPMVLENLQSISITSPNNADYTLNYDQNDPDCNILYSLFENKKGVKSIPSSFASKKPFEITYKSKLYSTTVNAYFSEDPANCYLEYKDGIKVTYYHIHTDAASAFLNSNYSEGVYSHSKLPVLTIGSTQLNPVDADWNYLTYSGTERKAREYVVNADNISSVGSVSSKFICQFDVEPDDVKITIERTDTNEIIYTGAVNGIGNIDVKENYNVTITIKATWEKNSDRQYNGTISYKATGRLHQPPYFFLSEPQIKYGEFVVLTAKNVIDVSKLEFSSLPEINYTPQFFKDGDYYRALIPISMALGNERKTFKLTLKYEETTQELDLLVLKRNDEYKTIYNVSSSTLENSGIKPDKPDSPMSNPYLALYQGISSTITANTDFSTELFNGRFDYGYSKGVLRAGFGSYIKYSAWSGDDMCRGFDYFYAGISMNDTVTAVNSGKIVFIGTLSYTGPVVIVDHGYGLLSWYCNLGRLGDGIAVGASVEKGTVIGYNGGGGLTETYEGTPISVHIALTVFGVPVDIAPLTTKGVIILDN